MGWMNSLLSRDIVMLKSHRFQRKYNWEVVLPNILPMPGELVAPFIQSIEYRDYEMKEAASMRQGAYQGFYPNILEKSNFSITFLETETALVKMYLNNWKNLLVDNYGHWNPKFGPKGYARDIILTYLTAEGLPLREVKFKSAFPLTFYHVDLDYKKNEILEIEIPFACDRIDEGVIGFV